MSHKLLIISHNFRREGAQLVAATLASELSKKDFAVEIVSLGDGVLSEELTAKGIPNSVVTMGLAIEKCSSGQYDTIVVNTIMTHKVVASLDKSVNVVWLIHESDIPTLGNSDPTICSSLQAGITANCSRVVFVCKASADEYQQYLTKHGIPTDNLTYIHNGIDANLVRSFTHTRESQRKALNITPDDIVLITAGTPKPRKGQLGIIKCLSSMNNAHLKLIIIGMGGPDQEYEKSLRDEAASIPEQVIFIERGPAEHVYKHMACSDVYVCNSVIESFPLAILEAMAMSLPVLSMCINGIPEQITTGVEGILYDDEDGLQSAIASVIDPAVRLRMSKAATVNIDDNFTLGKMTSNWSNLLLQPSAG